MAFFQCCNQQRKSIQRRDIHPPDSEALVISTKLNLKETFESIEIHTHRCPNCNKAKGQEFFYTWAGLYIDRTRGKNGKSKLQKINFNKEPDWFGWMEDKIAEPNGAGVVQGSLAFFPFTLGQRLVR